MRVTRCQRSCKALSSSAPANRRRSSSRSSGSTLCPSDRRGDGIARRSSSTRPFQTWRGLTSAILVAVCAAVLGIKSAVAAGCARCRFRHGGRLSLVLRRTRRFGLEPSSAVTLGLDQVARGIRCFPIALQRFLPLGPVDVLAIVLVFSVGELAMSQLSCRRSQGIVPTEAHCPQAGAG